MLSIAGEIRPNQIGALSRRAFGMPSQGASGRGRHMASNPAKQRGFVLVVVLWILVVVAVAAGYFAERVGRALQLANLAQENTQSAIGRSDMRAELFFRLGVTSLTPYGNGFGQEALKLDGRIYRDAGGGFVGIQDNRGLVNLNQSDDIVLSRLLGIYEIQSDRRGHMLDTLRDYIDADHLHRINGAETQAYADLGLPPPANAPLTTPWEAARVMGWNLPELWGTGKFASVTTAINVSGINPNTASEDALVAMLGISGEQAKLLVQQRSVAPFADSGELARFLGVDPTRYLFSVFAFPDSTLRISQFSQDGRSAIQFNISLTPSGNDGPWQINTFVHTSDSLSTSRISSAIALPPRSNAPPAKPVAFF